MVKLRKDITFLYIFLFSGAFNDLLRIGTTQINLFRILLPIALLITLLKSSKVRKLYLMSVMLALFSLFQSLLFSFTNNVSVEFSFTRYITFLAYYLCIATVVASVIVIFEASTVRFQEEFEKYLIFIGLCYLVVFIFIYHSNYSYANKYFIINNRNDYGAMIAAVLPIFYFKSKKKRNPIYILYVPLACIYLILHICWVFLYGYIVMLKL